MNAWMIRPETIVAATASATALGQALHVANDYLGLVWRADGASATLDLDLGANVTIDTVTLFGLDRASAGATLTVRARTAAQGVTFGSDDAFQGGAQPLFAGAERLANGRGVGLWSAAVGGVPACRYYRLAFDAIGAGVEVGRAVLGRRIVLERNFSFGGGFAIRDTGKAELSSRGALLRRRGRKLRTTGMTFNAVRRDEVEGVVHPLLERIGNTDCIALVTDPAPHAMRQRRCFFGFLEGDLGTVQRRVDAYQAQANLVSLA